MTDDKIKELIAAHLEGWNKPMTASIEHYLESGKVTGGLFKAIELMMHEYATMKVTEAIEKRAESVVVILHDAKSGVEDLYDAIRLTKNYRKEEWKPETAYDRILERAWLVINEIRDKLTSK